MTLKSQNDKFEYHGETDNIMSLKTWKIIKVIPTAFSTHEQDKGAIRLKAMIIFFKKWGN
jgi:hypothetical protein